MAKTSKKALGAAMAGVMAIGAVAGTVGAVQEVRAGVAEDVQLIHAKIEHFRKSLKTNYLGLKNVGQWQAYQKETQTLINKLPNGSSKDKYQARLDVCVSLLNAAAKVNHVEKSLVDNFHGIKNAETWSVYLADGKDLLGKVDKEFTAQKEELTERLAGAKSTVDGIIEKHNTALAAATKLYDEAAASKDLAKAEAALAAAKKLGTHSTSAALVAKCEALVAELSQGLVVSSAEILNGGEMVIKFNKALAEGTTITNQISLTGTGTAGATFELSKDRKSVSVYSTADGFDGAVVISIAKGALLTEAGDKINAFDEIRSIKDTTRATVVDTKTVSKYVFDINLSEPVKVASKTLTVADKDGVAVTPDSVTLENNGKTLRVTLPTTVTANEAYSVLMSSIEDIRGNVSVPTSVKLTVSDADKTAPTVASVVATSTTTANVKFSEEVTGFTDANKAKVMVNGTAVTKIEQDKNDKTLYKITWADAVTTSAVITIDASTVADLSGNANKAFSQVVTFVADKTAPEVVSSKVVTEGAVNYLELVLSEDVATVNKSALDFKFVDKYGVEKKYVVAADKIVQDAKDAKKFKIELTGTLDAAAAAGLKTDVNYTVKFVKGFFVDGFANESAEKSISFLNNGTAKNTALVATIGAASGVDKDGAFVTVNFTNSGVNVASALNTANYVVEGSEVAKVVLISNSDASAQVKVYLKDNTVANEGSYKVTVKGVTGFTSNVTEMESTVATVVIKENVRATVKSVAVATLGATSSVNVTFTEGIADTEATNDYELYIDGKKVMNGAAAVEVTTAVSGSVATFSFAKDLSEDIANGKSIKLVAKDSMNIKDASNNYVSASEIVIK